MDEICIFKANGDGLCLIRIEVPITNYLRDFAPDLGKYKVVQHILRPIYL